MRDSKLLECKPNENDFRTYYGKNLCIKLWFIYFANILLFTCYTDVHDRPLGEKNDKTFKFFSYITCNLFWCVIAIFFLSFYQCLHEAILRIKTTLSLY